MTVDGTEGKGIGSERNRQHCVKYHTTLDQANADHQRQKWVPIWGAKEKPPEKLDYGRIEKEEIRIGDEEVARFRSMLATFKHHTPVRHDAIRPHQLSLLTDQALHTLSPNILPPLTISPDWCSFLFDIFAFPKKVVDLSHFYR